MHRDLSSQTQQQGSTQNQQKDSNHWGAPRCASGWLTQEGQFLDLVCALEICIFQIVQINVSRRFICDAENWIDIAGRVARLPGYRVVGI